MHRLQQWLCICMLAVSVSVGDAVAEAGEAPEWIDLSREGLKSWRQPTGQWRVVGQASLDPDNPSRLAPQPGEGVLVNGPGGNTDNLVSRQSFGDLEAHIEFVIPKGSNSGVKFEGLYEVQILDSWEVEKPTASDCGGIYPRAELKPTYRLIDAGFPPKTNAARAPGEWQTLEVIFQAPRFDSAGKKTANARFVKVVLNGKVIHENVEVPTPTGHAWHEKETPTGPLLLQADHGPIAFRNLHVRPRSIRPPNSGNR